MRGQRGDTRERSRKEIPERPKPKRDRRHRQKVSTTMARREPQGKSGGQREKSPKQTAGSIVVCKASLIFVLGFSFCRWPRTKRNVVEARELFKDRG